MLSLARTKLAQENENVQKRITLLAADMTSFQTDSRFALAIIPYNTLLHLTPPQVNQTLTAARHHLLSSGQLFIDLANPFAIAQTPNDRMLTLERTFTDPRSGDIVLQLASNWLDEAQQRLHITWLYDATPPTGGAIHRTISQFDYYYLFPHQLEMALRQNGFQLEAMWGDYERTEFDEASERLLLLAHV
jgi:hypothetical protein